MRFVDFKNKKCFLILQETFFILWYNIKKLSALMALLSLHP